MEKMFATAYGECIAFSIENGEQSMEAEVIDLFCGVGGLTRGRSSSTSAIILKGSLFEISERQALMK